MIDRRQSLGWRRPEPHQRERALLAAHPLSAIALPEAAAESNNAGLCTCFDQLSLGSCTAQAWAQAIRMESVREDHPITPARLANYQWNLKRDDNEGQDVGATIGGAFEAGAAIGIASEDVWPYDLDRFTFWPGPEVYRDAFGRRGKVGVNYFPITGDSDALITLVKRVLTSQRGAAGGRQVTEKFCSEIPKGIIQPPTSRDKIAGGHAEAYVGHCDAEQWVLVQGSWGPDFREPGFPPGCYRLAYETVIGGHDFWFCAISTGGK